MTGLIDFFVETWNGFIEWIQSILTALLVWFKDVFLTIFELIMNGIVYVFTLLTPPDFLTAGMQSVASSIPNDVAYFLSQSGLGAGIAIYGTGVSFHLLRKLFTLGQW
jgi:hypothetical protein